MEEDVEEEDGEKEDELAVEEEVEQEGRELVSQRPCAYF